MARPTTGASSDRSVRSGSDPELTTGDVHDLALLLDLEALGQGRFRGRNGAHGALRPTIYGGQTVAQALRAAAHTVAPDRPPHSLHCYFLRRVRADRPVDYVVDVAFDGGRSSARQVRGIQDDELFFTMIVSFRAEGEASTFDWTSRREAPSPDTLPRGGWDRLVDVREISAGWIGEHVVPDHLWCRVTTPISDEPILHSCAIAYVSDYGGAFAALDLPGLPPGGATVDHVLRFHQPARADDWMCIDLVPERASRGRGSYTGTISDRNGTLIATLSQEGLLPEGCRSGTPPQRPVSCGGTVFYDGSG